LSHDDRASDQTELAEWAARGTIVTRTNRLAREIRSRIGQANARAGVTVFETPDVLPVEAWFEKLWTGLDAQAELLRDSAELLLWRETIAADLLAERVGEETLLSQVTELAASAAGAWRWIRRWQEPIWERIPLVPDVEAFRRWSQAFTHRLGSDWITAAQLPDAMALEAGSVRSAVGDYVTIVGFERIEPALHRLIDALRDLGVTVYEAPAAQGDPAAISFVPAASMDLEVRLLASSVRADIERDPSLNIGILAADLSSYRSTLERHLGAELDAPSLVPTAGQRLPSQRRVFDLAGAPALSEYGIIGHALDLLDLKLHDNAFADVSALLLAPYPRLTDDAVRERDGTERSRVELKLRRDNRLTVSLDLLATVANDVGASEFAKSVARFTNLLPKTPHRARPSGWARHFDARLRCFGWPGAGIDHESDEGVAFTRWREVIDHFAALDCVSDAMSLDEARTELRRACRDITVQAASGGLGVQAMGLLDAAGIDFDKVYVVGMTADVFPAPTRPHPLLPAEWQRMAGFPLASPEVEAEFAATIWRHMRSSCEQLVVSWPMAGARGETYVPSPVLGREAARAERPAEEEASRPWYGRPSALEGIEYAPADDGNVPPARVRRGGTALLRDYSACPFRAFAAWRLKAGPYDEPEAEPKATLRGELVHRVLEHVWLRIGDSQTLRKLDDAALREHVATAVEEAVAHRYPDASGSMHAPLVDWLEQQVSSWLEFEKDTARADWRVGGVEERTDVPIGEYEGEPAVTLRRLSVDRIDVLDDGTELIIDYKTTSSKLTTSEWSSDRPKDPQLPIYALALSADDRRVAGVAFANLVSRDDLSFRGVSDDSILDRQIGAPKKGSDPDWDGMQDRIDRWGATLSTLAEGYAKGNASVSPRNPRMDCTWCARQPLCRVFEAIDSTDEGAGDDG